MPPEDHPGPRRHARPRLLPGFALVVAAGLLCIRGAWAQEPPADVAGLRNPLPVDASTIARGRGLFLQNCAPCHGEAADGRGPGAEGLSPPPANLAGSAIVPGHGDGWLFFRLSNGKRGSAMPSFRHSLDEAERWSIVAYLRSLRPGPTPRP